jgi:hypothetical protein
MKYFDLGRHTRHVSTRSTEAQRWFDLGLNWSFGFNHEEGVKCFQKALEADRELFRMLRAEHPLAAPARAVSPNARRHSARLFMLASACGCSVPSTSSLLSSARCQA